MQAVARAFLIHPHAALVRWSRGKVRCSQVPDELKTYLRSDAVAFPLFAREERFEWKEGGETVVTIRNSTVARPPGPVESDGDLHAALMLIADTGWFGVEAIAAVPHVKHGRTDWD